MALDRATVEQALNDAEVAWIRDDTAWFLDSFRLLAEDWLRKDEALRRIENFDAGDGASTWSEARQLAYRARFGQRP